MLRMLKRPSKCFHTLASDRKRIKTLVVYCIAFLAVGAMLNEKWPFPRFYSFSICFLLIGTLSFATISRFTTVMKNITASVANQPVAKKTNLFYFRYCVDSPIYILGPLSIISIFGVSGCLMFGAIQLTPTLVWILTLFFVVVYISIIGYIQYVVLAIYIRNLAHGSGYYRHLPKSMTECVPAQLEWLQSLTQLSHLFRSRFFTLGSAYILAYGAFCWLPEMQANTASPAFFLLWSIIFSVIVLLFPTVSILEYRWIKAVVDQLKKCYIKDLTEEENIISQSVPPISPSLQRLLQTLCAKQIIDSRDYPLRSAWATCYAAIMSIFNFLAAAATIFQEIPGLTTAFQHMI